MSDVPKPPLGEDQVDVFDAFLLKERQALNLPFAKTDLAEPYGSAMAISGGGLRSSFFALGVIQTFMNETPGNAAPESNESCFERFDYMSTVSGGGFVGAAVSWLKHLFPSDGEYRRLLGAGRFGGGSSTSLFTWLDLLRQGGSFGRPTGPSRKTLAADMLGNGLLSLTIYTAILASILWSLAVAGVLPISEHMPSWSSAPQRIENLALLLVFFIGGTVLYSGLTSWLATIPTRLSTYQGALLSILLCWLAWSLLYRPAVALAAPYEPHGRLQLGLAVLFISLLSIALTRKAFQVYRTARSGFEVATSWAYMSRDAIHTLLGVSLTSLIVVGVLWSVPYAYHFIDDYLGGWLTAVVGSSVGLAGSVVQFLWARDKPLLGAWVTTLRVVVIGVLMVYGVLLLAYICVVVLHDVAIEMGGREIPVLAVVGVAGLYLALGINLNFIGVVRIYRDRVIEVFMPDAASIFGNRTGRAGQADRFSLTDLVDVNGSPQRPLHLVNCNVMMSDANKLRFRGRGGDSFVLSAMFCGSTATGWLPTTAFVLGNFTCATAIACSAADSNVPRVVAGLANSRNPIALLLLSVTNLRPGFWVRNPRASELPKNWHKWLPPNLLSPGIRHGLLGRGLSEDAFFVELNDGGRFDNTGLYELIRRRLKIVVLVQATMDPDSRMEDLTRVMRRVRIDFGVHIVFNNESYPLSALRPAAPGDSPKRGWAVASIYYPGTLAQGVLLYIQATPVAGSNVDDGFDEEQVEANRELGMTIAQDAIHHLKGQREPLDEPMTALQRTFGW